jgi:DNA-binding helix-hairpin-helix protein with protein kinase domain
VAKSFISSTGETIQVGRELGRGGEGSVFELMPDSPLVAKIYHRAPDRKKQEKLSHMSGISSPKLLKYVAWPQATIRERNGGPVVGYLMPKVSKRAPIQMLYSPAHRRQDHPNAAWNFLIHIARNVAAAFEVLHADGHILGDVNQGNVMVAADSTVVLIDSDSFQVNANGTIHYCEVGVSHFTPPELQGVSSFAGFRRTTNHDNFGLALLIFHVLFGGRHPYSGVPLRNGVGDALETDIKEFRYAYARDAKSRGISAPPRSIPLSMLPDNVERMFHAAFIENGSTGLRPTAQQWVSALDQLRNGLRTCPTSKVHVFSTHLNHCPWCALEQQGVIYFIDLGAAYVRTSIGLDVVRVWAVIDAVQPPAPFRAPQIDMSSFQATPLPPEVANSNGDGGVRVIGMILAVILLFAIPKLWFFALLIGWAGWKLGSPTESKELIAERARRKQAKDKAQLELNSLIQQARGSTGPEGFASKKNSLANLRDEHRALPEAERKEIAQLHSTAEQRQKQQFLERFFIDSASIPGVGPARKAALRSFGIETAADVSKRSVMQVRGFGESLTRAIMDWKASCERRFNFNPAIAVTNADKRTVQAKYGAKATQIERALEAGVSELRAYSQSATVRLAAMRPNLEAASKRLAQAEADLSVV